MPYSVFECKNPCWFCQFGLHY